MDDKEKKIVSRLATVISLLVVVIIVLLVIIVFLLRNDRPGVCGTSNLPMSYCGNATYYAPVLDPGMTMESYNKGKTVFKANCAVCHSMSDRHLTGPGLKNIADRVPSAGWLKAYILNADSMRRSGDPYSQKLYVESDSLEMTVFTGVLTKQDVTDLICYLKANRGS